MHNAPVRRGREKREERREWERGRERKRKASIINAISVHNAPSSNKNASKYFNQL